MQNEIKLKLRAPPAKIGKIAGSELIKKVKTGRARNHRLISIYYDTPRHTLKKSGISLRVRQDDRGFEQTVKAQVSGPAGVQTYRKWSGRVSDDTPCIGAVDDREFRSILKRGNRDKRLKPVFTTDAQRKTVPIEFQGSKLELAIDIGCILAPNGHSEEISEIELQLESGHHSALLKLALQLNESGNLALGLLTRAERGYALARPALRSGAYKALKAPLAAQMSVSEAFHAIMEDALKHLRANERPVADGLPEGVHQARVAIRRIRAALTAFRHSLKGKKRKRFNREFRWFQGQLSPARDWHVFLEETIPAIQTAHPGKRAAIARLRRIARNERARAHEEINDLFESGRYTRLILEFSSWLDKQCKAIETSVSDQSLTPFAAGLLSSTHRDFLVDTRPLSRMSAEDRHNLRKRGKKARYACEFFAALWPGQKTAVYLRAMKKLQEALGHINDLNTAAQMHRMIQQGVLDETTASLLQTWSVEAIRSANRQAQPAWLRFQKREPFWCNDSGAQTG